MLWYLNILNVLSRGDDPPPGEASTSQVESSQKKAARPRKRKAPVADNAANADEETTEDLWDDGSAQSLLPDDVAKIPGVYTFMMFSVFDDTAMPVLCVSFEFAG